MILSDAEALERAKKLTEEKRCDFPKLTTLCD